MNPPAPKPGPPPPRRRYAVHLSWVPGDQSEPCYIARIRPWAAHSGLHAQPGQRTFADECELIATINPLLPPGSDIRDVFDHIESPNGFYYLLHLSSEEAGQLGWPESPRSGVNKQA
jgi:hypothetical protein